MMRWRCWLCSEQRPISKFQQQTQPCAQPFFDSTPIYFHFINLQNSLTQQFLSMAKFKKPESQINNSFFFKNGNVFFFFSAYLRPNDPCVFSLLPCCDERVHRFAQ